jgi:hypothetical protein
MVRSTITTTTEIDLDIETAAKWFAGLSDDDWCQFFVIVAKEAETWLPEHKANMYWAAGRHLRECECSSDGARAMLTDIVRAMEYAPAAGVEPTQRHVLHILNVVAEMLAGRA